MSTHLERDLNQLKRNLLEMGQMVETAITQALEALVQRKAGIAEEVITRDDLVDQREIAIEEECLKILALHQPVAADLRFLVAVMKINNDLERMADHAVDIAERAISLLYYDDVPLKNELQAMAVETNTMVRSSLTSLVNNDVDIARRVIEHDEVVDGLNRQIISEVREGMRSQPEVVDPGSHVLNIAHHIERVADLSTNIAQDVLYVVEGKIVRHERRPVDRPAGPKS
ncbi:MAG: phosphate signaling complex protein PhoU [Planctomycetes bacterium]|nr:phosphate signaling complex protein PhoU [Planctomycetota bacterium]